MGASAFAFQATNAVGGGINQANAMRAQSEYQKKIAELNNQAIDYQIEGVNAQGEDAIKRGERAANKSTQKTRMDIGAQRAAMAANGQDVSGAGAADVLSETETIGAADYQAIKINALNDAFGFKSKAMQLKGEQNANNLNSRSNSNALEYSARSTMITGVTEGVGYGLQSYGKARDRKGSKSKKTESDDGEY